MKSLKKFLVGAVIAAVLGFGIFGTGQAFAGEDDPGVGGMSVDVTKL